MKKNVIKRSLSFRLTTLLLILGLAAGGLGKIDVKAAPFNNPYPSSPSIRAVLDTLDGSFPTSVGDAWVNENGKTAYAGTNSLFVGSGWFQPSLSNTVSLENGNYKCNGNDGSSVTFNMQDGVLQSITVSGLTKSERIDCNGTYAPPGISVADVIDSAIDFPTSSDGAWVNDNAEKVYYDATNGLMFSGFNILPSLVVTKSGDDFVVTTDIANATTTLTFNMENGVLSSIDLDYSGTPGSPFITEKHKGTYAPPAPNPPAPNPPTPEPTPQSETPVENPAIEEEEVNRPISIVQDDKTQVPRNDNSVPSGAYNLSSFSTYKGMTYALEAMVAGSNAQVDAASANKSKAPTQVGFFTGKAFPINKSVAAEISKSKVDVVYYFVHEGYLYSVTFPKGTNIELILEESGCSGALYIGKVLGTTRVIKKISE